MDTTAAETSQQAVADQSSGTSPCLPEGSSNSSKSADRCFLNSGTVSPSKLPQTSQQAAPSGDSSSLLHISPSSLLDVSPIALRTHLPLSTTQSPVIRGEPVDTLPSCDREGASRGKMGSLGMAQLTSTPRTHLPPRSPADHFGSISSLMSGSPSFVPASPPYGQRPAFVGSPSTYFLPPPHFSPPYLLASPSRAQFVYPGLSPPIGQSGYPEVSPPRGQSVYHGMPVASVDGSFVSQPRVHGCPVQYGFPASASMPHMPASPPSTVAPPGWKSDHLNNLASHPMFCDLQAVLINELEKSASCAAPAPSSSAVPGRVPVSVRVGLLQLRFMTLEPRFKSKIEELQSFYKLQSAKIESQRYQSLNAVTSSPSLAESVNGHFDQQHHSLMDRVERSLRLLSRPKPRKTASTPVVQAGTSVTQEETGRPSQRARFVPLNPLAVRVMSKWYDNNKEHPYPSYETCEVLAKAGDLTVEQVKKWFANRRMRSRNTKPLAEIAKRRFSKRSKSQNSDSILVKTEKGRDV